MDVQVEDIVGGGSTDGGSDDAGAETGSGPGVAVMTGEMGRDEDAEPG